MLDVWFPNHLVTRIALSNEKVSDFYTQKKLMVLVVKYHHIHQTQFLLLIKMDRKKLI
jgi:hypothetical protein